MNQETFDGLLNRITALEKKCQTHIIDLTVQCCAYNNIQQQEKEKDICCICLEELDPEKNIVILQCGHKINFTCYMDMLMVNIQSHTDGKCPLCREEILTTEQYRNMQNRIDQGNEERAGFGFYWERGDVEMPQLLLSVPQVRGLRLLELTIEEEVIDLTIPSSILDVLVDNEEVPPPQNVKQWIIFILSDSRGMDMNAIVNNLNDNRETPPYSRNSVRSGVSSLVSRGLVIKLRRGRSFMYVLG